VADLRRQRQATVAAAGAAVLVTTTASSASTLQGISHARTARSGGAGWPGCSASKACQQNEKAQHTSVPCRRIARRFLTWKSAQPSSSQPIWSVAGQRVAVGPSPVRRDIPCLTEVGPRGVESQRRWRILSTPDPGAGRVEDPFGVDDCADPPDPAAGGLELGESICTSSPRRVPEEIDRLRRHPKRRDGGRSWRRLPPRGQVIGGLPGATEEGDGADPTGAGRGHRLTARADR
jgi:hypothetical protein